MSNFKGTKTELINYLIARTPLVIIDTNERERVERLLAAIASEIGDGILYYTESGDVRSIGNNAGVMKANDNPLGFFFDKMKKQRRLRPKPLKKSKAPTFPLSSMRKLWWAGS